MLINLIHIDKILPAPQQASSYSVYKKSHLSLYGGCSTPSVIFVALFCTCTSVSMSLLYWVAQNWTQHSRCGLVSPNCKLRGCLSQPAGDAVPQGCLWLPLPWVHATGFCSLFPPGPLLQNYFPVGQPPSCTSAWGCPFPDAECCVCLGWTAWGLCQPLSPACQGPPNGCMTLWCIGHSSLLQCSGSSVKMLNRTGANIHSWDTLLVTGLQDYFVLLIITGLGP